MNRKSILKGEIAKRIRQLIREICLANEVQIINKHISGDYLHLLLNYPPRLSVTKLTRYIKRKTSGKLLQEYAGIGKKFWEVVYGRGDILQ